MKKLIFLFLSITIILCSCSPKRKSIEPTIFAGFYFDTYIEITIYDECNESLIAELTNICNRLDNLFSEDNKESDIYKINHNTSPVVIDSETASLINDALSYSKATDGIIDPTIQSIQQEWDFKADNPSPPGQATIAALLPAVDYRKISISNNTITVDDNQMITLGFIAKGYIADELKSALINHSISNAIINLGGNVVCMGHNPEKESTNYTIGIEKPFSNDSQIITTVQTTDNSIVTSGVYERCFYYEDNLYHHVLDTSTGYPITNYNKDGAMLYGVTIIGKNSETCDALSTTLLALGEEKGLYFLADYEGYCAIFVYSDDSIVYSANYNDVINK